MKKKQRISRYLQLFCMIFTMLILFYFFSFKELPADVVQLMIVVSLLATALSVLLIPKDHYSNRRIILNQVVYVLCIMGINIYMSHQFNWNQLWYEMVISLASILGMFLLIRYLIYHADQKEAMQINTYLKQKNGENDE